MCFKVNISELSVYGPDHHYQGQWLDVEKCYLIFLLLVVRCVRTESWNFRPKGDGRSGPSGPATRENT